MIPLLIAAQIREGDAYTIAHEPISSINLMERASRAFTDLFTMQYSNPDLPVSIYCGTGNNGGDGLAIARMLAGSGFQNINVIITRFSEKSSADFDVNFERLKSAGIPYTEQYPGDPLPEENAEIMIDAILGSGLNKPLSGDYERLVNSLNNLDKTVVAVDIPTGFYSDGDISPDAIVLKADWVITFQQPKINFLLPESAPHLEKWSAVGIGIDSNFLASLDSPYLFVTEDDIKGMLKPRKRFSNKGTYGHALIIAGQAQTMGAALLCSTACAHTGAGLTTACIPESGLTALNTAHPEIMAIVRKHNEPVEIAWEKFSTMAIGPGLGKEQESFDLICEAFKNFEKPVVIDADALNLLSTHPELWKHLPEGSILTPHMKEFDRLFGEHQTWWQRLQTAQEKAQELKLNIVLKNDYTIIATAEGKCYFNSTSNAAMASGGMGDVLTGMIAALLAQKYTPAEACIIGVYVHGKTGDDLALNHQRNVLLAGELAVQVPRTLAKLLA